MNCSRQIMMLSVVLCTLVTGCSDTIYESGPYGPCSFNDDCRDGDKCVNNWCEDIYHPEHKIDKR